MKTLNDRECAAVDGGVLGIGLAVWAGRMAASAYAHYVTLRDAYASSLR